MSLLNLELLNELPGLVQSLLTKIESLEDQVKALRETMPPRLVSTKEAARQLNTSESSIQRWVKEGELRSLKIGGSKKIDLTGVVARNADDIARMVSQKKKL